MSSPSSSMDSFPVPDVSLNKAESCSSELFSLVYGAFVVQLLQDERDDVVEVNRILDKVGFNIGTRIVDEFVVQTGINNCRTFRETADVIGRVAFKLFLGAPAAVQSWSEDGSAFSLLLAHKDNPLVDFVELPERYADLNMGAVLAGVVRGALEMIQIRCETSVVKDSLKGADYTEIRVLRKSVDRESFNPDDE